MSANRNILETVIHGYLITSVYRFSENEGVVIAHNVKAASPFVAWNYRIDNDTLNCFWGHYCDTAEQAHNEYSEKIRNR